MIFSLVLDRLEMRENIENKTNSYIFMISCEFAPNEQWDDAWISFKTILQPWMWNKGKEIIFAGST